jgi:hypothetical protein
MILVPSEELFRISGSPTAVAGKPAHTEPRLAPVDGPAPVRGARSTGEKRAGEPLTEPPCVRPRMRRGRCSGTLSYVAGNGFEPTRDR